MEIWAFVNGHNEDRNCNGFRQPNDESDAKKSIEKDRVVWDLASVFNGGEYKFRSIHNDRASNRHESTHP